MELRFGHVISLYENVTSLCMLILLNHTSLQCPHLIVVNMFCLLNIVYIITGDLCCSRNQCEQMRTLLSKRITKEIVQDWGEQVKMKKRLECEEEENDRMYAHLVSLDVENKVRYYLIR